MGHKASPTRVFFKCIDMVSHVLANCFTLRKDRPYIPVSVDEKMRLLLRLITFFLWIFCIYVRSYDAILHGCSPIALETLIPLARVAFVEKDMLRKKEDVAATPSHIGSNSHRQQGPTSLTQRYGAVQSRRKEHVEPQTAFAVEQFVWFILIFFTVDITNINRLSVAFFFVNTLHWIQIGSKLRVILVMLYLLGTYLFCPAYSLRSDFLILSGQRSLIYGLYSSYSLAFSLTLLMTDTQFFQRARRDVIWRITMLPKFLEKSLYKTPLQGVFSVVRWFLDRFFFLGFDFCMALCMWFSLIMFEYALEISLSGFFSAAFVIFLIPGEGWTHDFKKVFQETILCLFVYFTVVVSVFFIFPEHILFFTASAISSAFFVFYIAAHSPRRVRSSFPLVLLWLGMVAVNAYWDAHRGGINAPQLLWYNKLFCLNMISFGGLFMVSTAIHVYRWEWQADGPSTALSVAGKANIGVKWSLTSKGEHKQKEKLNSASFLTFGAGKLHSTTARKTSCAVEEKSSSFVLFSSSSFLPVLKGAGKKKMSSSLKTETSATQGNQHGDTYEEESLSKSSGTLFEKQGTPLLSSDNDDDDNDFDSIVAIFDVTKEDSRCKNALKYLKDSQSASGKTDNGDANETEKQEEAKGYEEEQQENDDSFGDNNNDNNNNVADDDDEEEKEEKETKEELEVKVVNFEPAGNESCERQLTKNNKVTVALPEAFVGIEGKKEQDNSVEATFLTTSISEKGVKAIDCACSSTLHETDVTEKLSHSVMQLSQSLQTCNTSSCNESNSNLAQSKTSITNYSTTAFVENTDKQNDSGNTLGPGRKQFGTKDPLVHVTENDANVLFTRGSQSTFTSEHVDVRTKSVNIRNSQRSSEHRPSKQPPIYSSEENSNKRSGCKDFVTSQTKKPFLHESTVKAASIEHARVKRLLTEKKTTTVLRTDTTTATVKPHTTKRQPGVAAEVEQPAQASNETKTKINVALNELSKVLTEDSHIKLLGVKKDMGTGVVPVGMQHLEHVKQVMPVDCSVVSKLLNVKIPTAEVAKNFEKSADDGSVLNRTSAYSDCGCSMEMRPSADDDVPLDIAQFHFGSSNKSECTSSCTEAIAPKTESPRVVPSSVRDLLKNFADAWMTRSGRTNPSDEKQSETDATKETATPANVSVQSPPPAVMNQSFLSYTTTHGPTSSEVSSLLGTQSSAQQGISVQASRQNVYIDRLNAGAYQHAAATTQPHAAPFTRAESHAQIVRQQAPMMMMMGDGRLAYYPVVALTYPTSSSVAMQQQTVQYQQQPVQYQQQPVQYQQQPVQYQQQPVQYQQQSVQYQQQPAAYPQVFYVPQQGYSESWTHLTSGQYMNARK